MAAKPKKAAKDDAPKKPKADKPDAKPSTIGTGGTAKRNSFLMRGKR